MMKVLKKRRLPLIIVVGVCLLALLAVTLLRSGQGVAQASEEIMSQTAQSSTITTTITGTGNLANASATSVKIPSGLTVDEVLVESGDAVQAGDTLAVFNAASVQTRIAEVQAEIDALDAEIESVKDDTESATISSNVSGRVKAIYVDEGDSVADSVMENGALMLISLDGLMAVDLTTSSDLATGDSVTVTLSDGTDVTGTVESVAGEAVTVTLTDDGSTLDDSVTVYDEDGNQAGTGTLYIHQPLTVTGTSGTVESVDVSENTGVSSGTTLLTLTDVSATAEYRSLLARHEEKVETLQTLLQLSQTNVLTAGFDGTVESVGVTASDADSTTGSTDGAEGVAAAGMAATGESTGISATLLSSTTTEGEDEDGGEDEDDGVQEIADLSGLTLTAPETGATPQTTVVTAAYSGRVSWSPADSPFQAETVYTARLTLSPAEGYGFSDGIVAELTEKDQSFVPVGGVISEVELTGGELTFVITYPATAEAAEGEAPQGGSDDVSGGMSGGGSASGGTGSVSGGSSAAGGSVSGGTGSASGGTATDTTAADATTTDGDSGDTQVTAFTIAPDDTMSITVSVDELDILSLEEGLNVSVTLDAIENETFTGTITKVNTTASSSGGVTKYSVEVSVDKTENMLPGMTASATITIQEAADVLVIPVAALQEMGGQVFVYTGVDEDEDTLTDQVEVETGLSDGTYVEIVSGLDEGDEVYYSISVSGDSEVLDEGNFSFDVGGGMGGEMPDMDNMPDMGDAPGGGGGGDFSGGGPGGGGAPGEN